MFDYDDTQREFDQALAAYDRAGNFLGGKKVIVNDTLPDHFIITTPEEIILSARGWEAIVRWVDMKNECAVAVHQAFERGMPDVLAWLRGAGHVV